MKEIRGPELKAGVVSEYSGVWQKERGNSAIEGHIEQPFSKTRVSRE